MSLRTMNRREMLRWAGAGVAALTGTVRGARNAFGAAADKPNVILVITDDQGYGDVGAHGNTMIQTPAMDRLWAESARLTDYHVDPTCAPTRSALMSGRYSNRTGVWHTIMGRSLMNDNETTLAEVFKANGYATGMFGKWHLGDNFPLRPEDQGFEDVTRHGGGGVGQGSDYWGNDYFDDTYWRNGQTKPYTGYCTDVWFAEAMDFIQRNQERPFFCYLSTNAPHGPLNVDPKYAKPYEEKGVPPNLAKFYGMIENIDENLAKLRKQLTALGLTKNTILIFTTDNGTANGAVRARSDDKWPGFNAGMRGAKGSEYDGGHRVPFFMHWPAGKLNKGQDIDHLCAHIDVQPTLIDLCGLKGRQGPPMDGQSLLPLLYGKAITQDLRYRTLFVHSQRIAHPEKWRKTAVMTRRWRLVNGRELYDMSVDPGQQNNVYDLHPQVVEVLKAQYDQWWDSLKPTFGDYVRIGLGDDAQNPTCLMSHDWLVEDQKDSAWHQNSVKNNHLASGPWAVHITRDGRYRVDLYRWPKHLKQAMGCIKAKVEIAGESREKEIDATADHARFELDLKAGPGMLQSWLTREDGKSFGAYFVWVERVG